MANLYFFGDSYCDCNENWVKLVSKQLKAPACNLGQGGSSIDFLLDDIIRNKHRINPDDFVIVCITDSQRHYFHNLHFRMAMVTPSIKEDKWNESKHIPKHLHDAYSTYVSELVDWWMLRREKSIKANHIINDILPRLNTKNIIYFNSINELDSDYEYYTSPQPVMCEPLYKIAFDYLTEKYKDELIDETVDEMHKFVIYKLFTPNHWVEGEGSKYHNYFFKRVNPVLDLIGAAVPLHPKI